MKRKRTIFIELTSLLDVILIMIFVLLMQARTQTAQAMDQAEQEHKAAQEISRELGAVQESMQALREDYEGQIAEIREEAQGLEQEIQELEEEAEGLRRRLNSRELVLDNSLVLTLSITEEAAIRLERSPEGEDIIPYDWNNDTYAYNRLRSLLAMDLEEAGERSVFLIFQYDRSRIYKTEYDMILKAVQEMKLDAKEKEIPLNFIEMDIQE